MQCKAPHVWHKERLEHRHRVAPWIHDRVTRSLRGKKHPVYDFLFEYYSFRPAHLQRYSPGLNVILEQADVDMLDWPNHFTVCEQGAVLESARFPQNRLLFLRWGTRFLETTLDRAPVFHCLGLHEWAMVYRANEVRHEQFPLRLSQDAIAQFVESQQLCCTHFDAFRFFTPQAAPRNRYQLSRYSVFDHDQPGCIHANMDLYKWAFQLAPYICSELIADAFDLAWQAREVDMRASPYDLSALGFAPIALETRNGREEYVEAQRRLFTLGQPIRARLHKAYAMIEKQVSPQPVTGDDFSKGTNS